MSQPDTAGGTPFRPRNGGEFAAHFWSLVDTTGDCWLWRGPRSDRGDGLIRRDGRAERAHRVAVEMATGTPIPPGAVIRHCRESLLCVRPHHLSPQARLRRTQLGVTLTAADVREIRRRYRRYSRGPSNQTGLAEAFGVCQSTIHQIVAGRHRLAAAPGEGAGDV